jgi:glycine/D-amino acid oxidase-like deaminating enzyme
MSAGHDYIIVGAGIAGLHCARALVAKGHSVLILEKYKYIGGRINTFRKGPYQWKNGVRQSEHQWESGAGRVHKSHRLIMREIDRYGLHWKPIGSESLYQPRDGAPLEENTFFDLANTLLRPLSDLPPPTLAANTIRGLLTATQGQVATDEFLARFPYRAEVDVMRADAALNSFLTGDDTGYGVVAEGLDRLIEGYVADLASHATILLGHGLEAVRPDNTLIVRTAAGVKKFKARHVILALHAAALKQIDGIRAWPLLKQLIMCPLLRTYAVYPRAWFPPKRIVFGHNPVRYFIPVGPKVAMCSYTDASDAGPWMHDADHNPDRLNRRIHAALRRALPGCHIPDPTFFKAHPWTHGCTYWAPNTHYKSVAQLSQSALTVRPGLHCCGESFSTKQAWMEGALEHAEALLKVLDV